MICLGCGSEYEPKNEKQTRCPECVVEILGVLNAMPTATTVGVLLQAQGEVHETLTLHHAVQILNEALEGDGRAVTELFRNRAECNAVLRDHPTIRLYVEEEGDLYFIGLLGLLNGMFPAHEERGAILAEERKSGQGWIRKFVVARDQKKAQGTA